MCTSLLWLLACRPEADVSSLPPLPAPPVVPDVPEAPRTGESRAFTMDFGGGQGGAPFGMAFFIPPGTAATATAGALSDGGEGFTLRADAPGDAVVCTQPMKLMGEAVVSGRMRVAEVGGGTQDWHGLHVELRARDAAGALISAGADRYVPVRRVPAAGDWETWEETVKLPEGTAKGELCWRFVGVRGAVEVDEATIVTPGVPLPVAPPIVSLRWDLDEPGPAGSPEGVDFLIPAGTRGAELETTEIDGAKGVRFSVSAPGNAVMCTQSFSVAPGMVFRGRMRLREIESDARAWTGFVAEVRAYDLIGGLASAESTPFSTLKTWKAPGDWETWEVAFAPPAGAVSGKLCFRFVEATGIAELDEVSVGP